MTKSRIFKSIKTVRTLTLSILIIIGIIAAMNATNAQTYDPTNVAVINALITNNGLDEMPDAPETWDFAVWNSENPMQITQLDLQYRTLTGVASFAGLNLLTYLYCDNNNLSELDITNNTALVYLGCYSNNLSELDVTNNTALYILDCFGNNLSELDITNNTALYSLDCSTNILSELDITNNTALVYLYCFNNNLSELDVTNNTALVYLYCSDNNLSELGVTNNTALQTLQCNSNNLSELDITNNTALLFLWCNSNNLSELDITNNTALVYLYCSNNNLLELDITNNTALYILDCSDNNLSELDITNNTALAIMYCFDNNLSELDLSNLENLTYFLGANQTVAIDFFKNEIDEYSFPIWLNSPEFGNSAISYSEGILSSSDNTVSSTSFSVQTGKENYTLSGTMNFTYDGVGIFNKSMEYFTLYPNPAKDNIFVECEGYSTIKIYDMLGKEVLNQNGNGKTTIDIKHLPNGVYNVTIVSNGRVIENNKVVKQ